MPESTWWEQNNPIRVFSGGTPTGQTMSRDEQIEASAIFDTLSNVTESLNRQRMIDLQRSMAIALALFLAAIGTLIAKKRAAAGALAVASITLLVASIAQYV